MTSAIDLPDFLLNTRPNDATGFRPRPNGNTPVEGGDLMPICGTQLGTSTLIRAKLRESNLPCLRRKWVRTRQMDLDCTTCAAMSGNGARTGLIELITVTLPSMILRARATGT